MIPNPPKTKRITKALLLEVMGLLDMIEYRVMDKICCMSTEEWLNIRDRLCACRAHLHAWHEEDKRKKRMKHGKPAKVAVPPHG